MEEKRKDPVEIRNKIISLIRIRGPCLPVHISRETKLDMLFASAFLSELASDGIIKISNMKVGSSPLYFLPGQEEQLEKFYAFLPGKEREAFLLLKEKKVLEDTKLEPSIRVALRSIKDFAYPLIPKLQEKILFWKFHSLPIEQASEIIEKILEIKKPKIEKETAKEKAIETEKKPESKIITEKKHIQETIELKKQEKKETEKPLLELKEIKPKQKEKRIEKSDFVNKVISLLQLENIEILEEKITKKKEYSAIIRINSDIGKIKILCISKDKKSITENDLTIALQNSQSLKMHCLFISSGNLNKKAELYLQNYSNLIKFRKI